MNSYIQKINGTLINYYFHCKTQCWLFANKINLEDNSEDVAIGRVLHLLKDLDTNNKNTEITIENIKIDKITEKYLIEVKKSNSDMEATKWQVLLYLYKLKEKGIYKKGKIEYLEAKKKTNKVQYIDLNEKTEKELTQTAKEIINLTEYKNMPTPILNTKCKKCAYYTYCFI